MDLQLCDISVKLTEQILDEIIQKIGGKKHTSWKFTGGTKKGDSYISETFRIIIYGEKENGDPIELHTYVKILPKNLARRKTFRCVEFSQNECFFYNVIMAKFGQFQAERNIQNGFNEVPNCLKAYSDGENDFIILEDLSLEGYRTPQRQNGFSYEICKLIMETLGKYHAMSFAIQDQEPEEFEKLTKLTKEIYYAEKYRKWYDPILQDQVKVTLDAISREYGGTHYEQKTREFVEQGLYDTMISLANRRNKYSVISHGDCWALNFLMKFQGSKPIQAKILDFQLVRYGSPALDVSFFIYSCTTQDLREAHYDDLLKAYYKSICDLLNMFGTDPEKVFPYSALLNELKDCGCYGIGMGMESVPIAMLDDSEVSDINAVQGDDEVPLNHMFRFKPIVNAENRRRFADIFKHAIDQGYL